MSPTTTKNFLGVLAVMYFVAAVSAQSAADYLDPQNAARQALGVGIPDLVWNDNLAGYASNWAQYHATQDNCNGVHSGGSYGETIYWSSGTSTPGDAVQLWLNENQYYNHASNTCQANQMCRHYTHIVWRNTQRVGCGAASCAGAGAFVVCSYDPAGNFTDQSPY